MSDHTSNSSDDEEFWVHYMDSKIRLPKTFQDRRNPFDELTEKKFKERRGTVSTKVLFFDLCMRLKINLSEYPSDRNRSVTPINQILITLRFYATGTFQLVVGDAFGVDKAKACRIIHKVTPLIAGLSDKFVRFPTIQEELKINMGAVFQNTGFPGIIGAVDGTHVPIFSLGKESAEAYRNRKGCFSINVQLISDPSLYIHDVVARWPGSCHDSTIFDNSSIRAKFENNLVPDGYLIGDSGYPCRSYLLTPVPEPVTSTKENNYNISHVQARNCIERANGVIKRRFSALKYGLRVKTERIPEIVVAIAVLHNIARIVGDSEPPIDKELDKYIHEKRKFGLTVDFEDVDVGPPPVQNASGSTSQRSAVIQSYF